MFKKSYAAITAPLRKMIEDLRKHAETKTTEANLHGNRAEDHAMMQSECLNEADAAIGTSERLAELLGEETASQQ